VAAEDPPSLCELRRTGASYAAGFGAQGLIGIVTALASSAGAEEIQRFFRSTQTGMLSATLIFGRCFQSCGRGLFQAAPELVEQGGALLNERDFCGGSASSRTPTNQCCAPLSLRGIQVMSYVRI
jgi:hypothetical protein